MVRPIDRKNKLSSKDLYESGDEKQQEENGRENVVVVWMYNKGHPEYYVYIGLYFFSLHSKIEACLMTVVTAPMD